MKMSSAAVFFIVLVALVVVILGALAWYIIKNDTSEEIEL